MQAALMERGSIWVDTVPDPVPLAGEVLVKTRACGICGSDLHAARHTEAFVNTSREAGGAFKLTTFDPVVLGHEFAAEIVDYGPETPHDLPLGTLVCSVPMLVRQQPLAVGYSAEIPGGFAQYMVLSRSLVLPVPAGTPDIHAALTEPMAVGLHAVNKARLDRQRGRARARLRSRRSRRDHRIERTRRGADRRRRLFAAAAQPRNGPRRRHCG